MSSAAVGTHHSGAGPLSLMSCVRESSPLQDYEPPDSEKNAASKRKFWNPKKWFKRKNKVTEDVSTVEIVDKDDYRRDDLRSRSTSELSITEEPIGRRTGPSMHQGLSVSHDSVFHSPNSGSDIDLDVAQSSSSLSISQPQIDLRLQTELSERLRSRRGRGDTSEDDEGLPHSPCNSPTTTEALLDKTAIKDLPTKSHSTCSDGSLLSMGSSEMDEESFSQQSRHSSKLSLQEKKSSDQDSDLELGPSSSSAPLNHSAAHHRVSVRPKRRAPHRNRKGAQLSNALPTTPEVNEESSIRSATPENVSKEVFTEHFTRTTFTETQLKCSSLPPGLAAPGDVDVTKLNRSRSNADSKSQEQFTTLEEDIEKEEKTDRSFFDRIFPRRSGKKRKSKEDKPPIAVQPYKRTESKPIAAPRSGAAARQRIQPIDLPPSPDVQKKDFECVLPKPSPEKSFGGTSPLQAELENKIKQRQINASLEGDSAVISKVEIISKREKKEEFRSEEFRSKMKIPALSSLQQRVLTLNDEVDEGFKSLTDLPEDKPAKPVAKSHSFKSVKPKDTKFIGEAKNEEITVAKAASLDCVKQLEEKEEVIEHNIVKDEIESICPKNFDLAADIFSDMNNVTISGPSHTAVVNVTDSYNASNIKTETCTTGDKVKQVTTKESVSVTKIQLKRESTSIVTVPTNSVPEFLNRQLNKVETKSSNVVFSMNSPRIIDEQSRPKSFEDKTKIIPRKFSQEDIEIVEKSEDETQKDESIVTVVSPVIQPQPRFKKNEVSKRKSSTSSNTPESPCSDKPFLRSRSVSLDSLKGEDNSDKSSQDSLDKLEVNETPIKSSNSVVETVVLRKKSQIKQRNDDEPELMKVFARRSLKAKDTEGDAINLVLDNDAKTRDSDKENQMDSPMEERRKSEVENREPLSETIKSPTSEVVLRKNSNHSYVRGFSLNPLKDETKAKKQGGISERRMTDNNWISNMKNGDDLIERKISQDEIITEISPKSDFITEELLIERKNFNQRKAEWEKRAQEAQKKSVP